MADALSQLIEHCQKDPVFFCEHVLGDSPWAKQREIMESVRDNRVTAVPSCHSSGKSWVAARIVLWFLYSFPGAKVITTAPTDRQIRGILWGEIHQARARAKVPLGGYVTVQRIEVDENWWAWGFTAPDYDPNRFQGFHAPHILVVVDEAAGISSALSQQIDSLLSGGHARKLEIGNPVVAGGTFQASCESPLVKTLPISAFDTPNFTTFGITEQDMLEDTWRDKVGKAQLPYEFLISPQWVAERLLVWGSNSEAWVSRVCGRFPDIVEGAYYTNEFRAIQAEGRIGDFPYDEHAPVITGWDIGIRDATSIWFGQWQGSAFTLIDYYENVDQGFKHYAEIVQSKKYIYSYHAAPHDMAVREWTAGRTRIELASQLGVNFVVNPQLKVTKGTELNEGIDRVRWLLARARFNEKTTVEGVAALRNYRRQISPVSGEMKPAPVHDWASHGADAFRTLAVGLLGRPAKIERPAVSTGWVV